MKTMPWLTGAALAFWGCQTGYWWLGLLAAAILEGGRLARWEWDLTAADYRRIWDLSAALFATLAVYCYTSEELLNAAHAFLRWLPIAFLPMILAQWFGPLEKIDYRVFSWWLRYRHRTGDSTGALNIAPLYFAGCLFAASAAGMTRPTIVWFYAGFTLLVAGALWQIRPQRSSPWIWLAALAVAALAGYEGHRRLHDLQAVAETALGNWIATWGQKDPDPVESRTAIGQIGKIKLSGRIVWRLEARAGRSAPELLRQASYNSYRKESWYSTTKSFAPATLATNESDMWILSEKTPSDQVSLEGFIPRGQGLLPLPSGAASVRHLPSAELEINTLGAVRVKGSPAFVQFRADYGPAGSLDGPPDDEDIRVPDGETDTLAGIVKELGLDRKTPREALLTLERFFEDGFRYTTFLASNNRRDPHLSPLGDFLVNKKAGHCEYFATATVLLLRQAGIPARYATGYAVHETRGKDKYLVRERHAHAWCRVYRKDQEAWDDFDTTPATWSAIEDARASLTQPIADLFSWLWYEFSKWRYGAASARNYVLAVLVVAAVVLALQILLQRRRKKPSAPPSPNPDRPWAGDDSGYYQIERFMADLGWGRLTTETPRQWQARLTENALGIRDAQGAENPKTDGKRASEITPPTQDNSSAPVGKAALDALDAILRLHYRYRFDPQGLRLEEKQALRERSRDWLEHARSGHYKQAPPS